MNYTSIIECNRKTFETEFNNTDDELFYQYLSNDIISIAKLANKYSGLLYGGIVRSFMLRKEDTRDIDIWFKNETDKDNFVKELEQYWTATQINLENGMYDKTSYKIISQETKFSYNVDCVIDEEFTITDFNVNCFTYNGSYVSFEASNLKCGTKFDYKEALNDVYNKRMKYSKIYYDNRENGQYCLRIFKFTSKGWEIYNDKYNDKAINMKIENKYFPVVCN